MTDTGKPVPFAHGKSVAVCGNLNASGCSKKLYKGWYIAIFVIFAIMKRKATFCCDTSRDM